MVWAGYTVLVSRWTVVEMVVRFLKCKWRRFQALRHFVLPSTMLGCMAAWTGSWVGRKLVAGS